MLSIGRDPNGKLSSVSGNKEGFTQRQFKVAEVTLNSTLSYRSWKDFKWIIRNSQIMDCPVLSKMLTTHLRSGGKNVAALKGKTPRNKPNPVTADLVQVPTDLLKLHKDVFLTLDIFS
jgi:hypothetical protein